MTNLYNHYKNLFESTKPIRGRVINVRPIGKRRRDWETIRMAGDVVECVLYETPVVRYYPDGGVGVMANDWVTPSTAEFMYTHSPFAVSKKKKILWVCPNRDKKQSYPLPNRGETRFVLTGDNPMLWKPEVAVVQRKKVIDRNKAKQAREPYMPFLKFVETFLKMSDGWVMDATRAEVGMPNLEYWGDRYNFGLGIHMHQQDARTAQGVLDMILRAEEDDYLKPMCALLQQVKPTEKRLARVEHLINRSLEFSNMRYDHKLVRAKLYRLIEKCEDVHAEIEVKYE